MAYSPSNENALFADLVQAMTARVAHARPVTTAVTTPNAVDDASALALAAALASAFTAHLADVVTSAGTGAHAAADTVNAIPALGTPTRTSDLPSYVVTLRGAINQHLTQAGLHLSPDTTNAVKLSSFQTSTDDVAVRSALNLIKTQLNAHINSAMASVAAT